MWRVVAGVAGLGRALWTLRDDLEDGKPAI